MMEPNEIIDVDPALEYPNIPTNDLEVEEWLLKQNLEQHVSEKHMVKVTIPFHLQKKVIVGNIYID